jgi:hypothetical protein
MNEAGNGKEPSAGPDWIITIVPGTWAYGLFRKKTGAARWFDQGSVFRSSLHEQFEERAINAFIEIHPWSGENSIVERNGAATKLVERLREQKSRSPNSLQAIVAHSHGGNVALRAMHLMGDAGKYPIVVTIATPFLQVVSQRGETAFFSPSAFALSSAISFGLAALFYAAIASQTLGTLGLLVLLFVQSAASRVAFWLAPEFLANEEKIKRLIEASFYDLGKRAPPHILVVRGVDDEASTTLTLGRLGIRLSALFSGLTAVTIVSTGMSLVGGVVFISWYFFEAESRYFYPLMSASLILGGAYLIVLVFSQLCRGVFGRELLTGSVGFEVVPNSSPDCGGNVHVITLPAEDRPGLRHGLYNHSLCAKTIAIWLGNAAQQAGQP